MVSKNLTKLALAMCFILSIGASETAAASETTIDVEYWKPSITNNSEVRTSNSTINLKDDLGLNKKNLLNVSVGFKREKNDPQTFYIKNEGATFNSTKNLNHTVRFDGAAYYAGEKVDSAIKFNHFQIGMRNEKVLSSGKFTTNYQFNHGKLETRMNDITYGFGRTEDQSINCLGIGFGWESLGDTRWFAEVTPLSLFGRGGYSEYGFGIKTTVGKGRTLALGYKSETIQAGKNDADHTKLNMKGAYLSLNSSF